MNTIWLTGGSLLNVGANRLYRSTVILEFEMSPAVPKQSLSAPLVYFPASIL